MKNWVSYILAVLLVTVFLVMGGCGGGGGGNGSDSGSVVVTHSITGKITSGGFALTGATVSMTGNSSASTTTDSNGNYSFSNLQNGTYTLTPSMSGYTFSPSSQSATVSDVDVTGKNFTASPTSPPPAANTTTLSPANPVAAATADADTFRFADATTVGYTATITSGFKYPVDKIAYPAGGQRPAAAPGGVNDVIDGRTDLTWASNGKEVTIHLTDLDPISEGALQSSAPNAAADIYTTY